MPTFSKDLPSDALRKSQVDSVIIIYKITAAKTASQLTDSQAPSILMFDTGDSSQAAVDALLGTDDDITYATSFGSTALGSNAVGLVVKNGAAKSAVYTLVTNTQTAGGTPALDVASIVGNGTSTTALANTLSSKYAVTAAGNLYLQFVGNSNLDACTAGFLVFELFYVAK